MAASGLMLVSACSGGGGTATATPTSAPAAATTSAAAAATTEAAATTQATTASRPLAAVFPDVDLPTCAPADAATATTGTGVRAVEAYTCDYSAAAANAQVIFAEWPDAAGAQAWYQDTVNLGPRIEDFQTWAVNGTPQGPLWTATNPNGVVISTGVYEGQVYTWEIRAGSLDDVNTVGQVLNLLQSSQFGG